MSREQTTKLGLVLFLLVLLVIQLKLKKKKRESKTRTRLTTKAWSLSMLPHLHRCSYYSFVLPHFHLRLRHPSPNHFVPVSIAELIARCSFVSVFWRHGVEGWTRPRALSNPDNVAVAVELRWWEEHSPWLQVFFLQDELSRLSIACFPNVLCVVFFFKI